MTGFVKALIAPPRCVGCGERLNVFEGEEDRAFCKECRVKWEKAKRKVCVGCRLENVECICESKLIKGTRILSLVKFGSENSCDRLIYALKRRRNRRYFDFAVDELYKRLRSEGQLIMTDLSGAVFVNVPRNIHTKNLFGFDHAQLLASALAEKTGGEYRNLLFPQ